VLVAVRVAVPVLVSVGVLVRVAVYVGVPIIHTVRPFIRLPTAGYPRVVDRIYAVAPVTPLNASLAIVGLSPKKYTLLRALAPWNAKFPMDVTPAGMVMAVSALALLNAESPMDVTPAGMVIAVSALALLNAESPMDVSWLPAAKVTVVSALALLNA
jgi:hypothetical protein